MISKHLIIVALGALSIGASNPVEQKTSKQIAVLSGQSHSAKTEGCNEYYERQEIRTLNKDQFNTFIKAIKDIKFNGMYDQLCQIHLNNNDYAHATPYFLPWHREFLHRFEKELRKVSPGITLPYWDWSIDSQAPERSKILSSDYFGNQEQNCLNNGALAGWQCQYPETHCLERRYDGGRSIGSFYSPELLKYTLDDQPNYDEFRNAIEGAPHGSVHNNIGGDMSTMGSCNDPLFYLHHAFIDKLWSDWQNSNNNFRYDFGGKLESGYEVKSEDVMEPFDTPVYESMSISDNYCYSYGSRPQIPRPVHRQNKKPTAQTKDNNKYPSPYDREDLDHLRTVPELPDSYITMMKLNKTRVRMQEQRSRQEVIRLNTIGYISDISLGLNGLLQDLTEAVVDIAKDATDNAVNDVVDLGKNILGIFGPK